MKEVLNNQPEALQSKPEQMPNPVDAKKLAAETIAADVELQKVQAGDKQASEEKYNKVLEEARGLQNPAESLKEIDAQLKELAKEKETRSADYKNLVTQTLGSSPMAGMNFGPGKVEALAKKYPGIDKIAEAINIAKEQSKPQPIDKNAGFFGKMFGKKVLELSGKEHALIDNFLTTGGIGIINGVNNPLKEYKSVIEFLAKNSPELLKARRTQEIVQKLFASDAEFAKSNPSFLVKPEQVTDQPASAREAINSNDLADKIKELETRKMELAK